VHVFDLRLDQSGSFARVVNLEVEGGDLESISTCIWVTRSLKILAAVRQIKTLNEIDSKRNSEHPVIVDIVSE
jgi:hypothetical protein